MQFCTISRMRRFILSAALAGAVLSGGSLHALAAGESGVTVTSGSLSGGTITFGDFGSVTLNGTQRTTTATWSIANITDARGTGAGWNLSLTLTQFKEYDTGTSSYVSGGKTLSTSSLKVTTAPTVSLADSSSSPTNTITAVSTNTALDTGSAVKLLSAAADGGMGSYSLGNMTSTLTVPASAYAKTYKTDATVSLSTGP